MNEDMDFCKFFEDIEKDPSSSIPSITVRDLLRARAHIQTCETCAQRAERVLADAPPQSPEDFLSKN